MKKSGAMLISILAAALLCSCGDTGDTDGSPAPASAGSDKPAAATTADINETETSSANETSAVAKESKEGSDSSAGLPKKLSGVKTGANGREYREYNADDDCIIDGFNYRYEEGLTHSFFAFDKDGETWLFDPSSDYFTEIDPDGLCEFEAGKAYTLTYDVQHKTGGIAGVHESYLLNVESCEPADISSFFEQKVGYVGIWNGRQTHGRELAYASSGQRGNGFICVRVGDGYNVYKEDGSELHFDEDRQVIVPYSTVEETREEFNLPIGFSVLCNKGVTDEQIISAITSGRLSENKDIFLIGSCSDSGKCTYAAECAGIDANSVPFYEAENETDPEEGFRRVITMADFERGITAEEAGLPEDVFYIAETEWKCDRDDYRRFKDGEERYPYSRGILILGGSFLDSDMLYMDEDARFCVTNSENIIGTRSTDHHMNYAIISIRQEYLDLIPQE